ncbi:hypothetical protein BGZ97_012110 [Linnemannia gamsii]|uniref:Uncharacterized protein n=1 Tax=Linnemannia gamsii TaxID=64522 RepID=A0A9P6RNB6_9FUNG|nr:hypothetical protein BGZ97_012110 [Linnemannia gamsii]
MQLKTILAALAAVIVVAAAPTPAADTNAIDIHNEDLNDTNKIIYFPGGGRPPTVITVKPYGPFGPILVERPGKRADDENEDSKIIWVPGGGRPPKVIVVKPYGPHGPVYLKRDDVNESSKATMYYKPGVGYYPAPTFYPFPRKRNDKGKSSKKKKGNTMNDADVDHEDYDWEDDNDENATYM